MEVIRIGGGEESVADGTQDDVSDRSRGCGQIAEVAGKCGELRGAMVRVGARLKVASSGRTLASR